MRLLISVVCLLAVGCARAAPDLVLVHAQIFGAGAVAHALAIRGDRITAVGDDAAVLKTADRSTVVYDLGGRLLLPGFNDAHVHWMPEPAGEELPLTGMDPPWDALESAIKDATARAPKGRWLYATVGPSIINDRARNRTELDPIAPDHPVWVWSSSGHGLIVNTAALRRLGLRDDEPDADPLHYDRLPGTNRLSGRFTEYEHWVQSRRLAALASRDEKIASLRQLTAEAVRFGITSMQMMSTMSIGDFAASVGDARLPIRMRLMDYTLPGSSSWTSDPPSRREPGPLTRISGLKWVLDGTPVERGAALRGSYADAPQEHGRLDLDPAKIRAVVERAWRSNDQVLFHAVGDRAVAALFDAMEATAPASGWRPRRVRVEHGDGMAPDLVARAVRLGIVVVQNPVHFSIAEVIKARLGSAQVQPFRSLAAAGIPIAIGSDGPMNPYLNLMFATTHPVNPAEAIPVRDAVAAYTRGSAYAEFADDDKGTLAPGKLADLAVPSEDIFSIPADRWPAVHNVLTIVGGRLVFDDGTIKREEKK